MPLPSRSIGGWVGALDPNDYYRFTLAETTRVSLSMSGGGGLSLLGGTGTVLDSDTASPAARDASILRTLAAGDYVIRVNGSTTIGTAYVVTLAYGEVAQPPTPVADAAGNSLATARQVGVLAGGTPGFADWVGPGDASDVYRFSLVGMTRLDLSLAGLSATASVDLLDLSGTVLGSASGSAVRNGMLSTFLDSGEYYLRVQTGDATGTGYRLLLGADPIADLAGNSAAAARALGTLGTTPRLVTDWVGSADPEDWYAFTLATLSNVSIRLSLGFEGSAGSVGLSLRDPTGAEVAADAATTLEDGSLDLALAAGTWRVRVTGAGVPATTSLGFSATAIPDAAGSTPGTARALGTLPAPGSATVVSVSDWVGAADPTDLNAFTVAATTDVTIALSAAHGAPGMVLRNAGNVVLASATAGWLVGDGSIRATLAPGSYTLAVENATLDGAAYTLSLATATPAYGSAGTDLAGGTLATARTIPLATPGVQRFADWVGSTDVDWYRFTLTADRLVDLRAGFAAATASTLVLTDATGAQIAGATGSSAADASIIRILDPGSYGVRLTNADAAGAGYSLAFQSATVADGAGDSLAAERVLGPLGAATQSFQDHVGQGDPADWYGFSLAAPALLSALLSNLHDTLTLTVTDAAGSVLRSVTGGATSDGDINLPLAAGSYHVSVTATGASSGYTLALAANAIQDTGGNTIGQATALVPSVVSFGDAAPNLLVGAGYADELHGGVGPDTLVGLAGGDTLFGGAGNDLFAGNAGQDSIDGGDGLDTANWAGPRSSFAVRSLVADGRIVTLVTDLTGAEGADTLAGVEQLGFSGGTQVFPTSGLRLNRSANFDGGAYDDALFWDSASGSVFYNDVVAGGGTAGLVPVAVLPAGTRVAGRGDLNMDGRGDVLVQDNATGSTWYLDLSGGPTAWRTVTTTVTPTLRAIAVADFTGDGQNDVLFRDDSGFLFYAQMKGGAFDRWANVGNLGTAWRTIGAGDFNGDGVADVAFQEIATGFTVYRDLVNSVWGYIAGGLGTTWVGRAVADVNGDGYDDLVFRNVYDGMVLYVNMAGGSGLGAAWGVIAPAGLAGWEVRGAADPDNDGYTDLILQNLGNGQAYWRDMDAGVATGAWGLLAPPIGGNWLVGL